jgi:taurine dioxygenase
MNNATVKPLSGFTGAEIGGVDISRPLSPEDFNTIDEALLKWKVIFFRDQSLDHSSHIAFARQFGKLTDAHPHEAPLDGFPEIYTLDHKRARFRVPVGESTRIRKYNDSNEWHTDVTVAVNPPAGSILRADVVPPYGGDTHFANMVAAYEALADPVQGLLDHLSAEHFYTTRYSLRERAKGYAASIESNPMVAHHPVVRVHPRTGEKALFVNPLYTDHIIGVSPLESKWILEFLFAHMTRPEFTVRFKWEPGSVAFWDNRSTSHLPPQDLGTLDPERILHRVTLTGEVPIGTDGRPSELIEGFPFGLGSVAMD